MKIYLNNEHVTIGHGIETDKPLHMYVVRCDSDPTAGCKCVYTFAVEAESDEDAIHRLVKTCEAVIEAVRQSCAPEDLEQVQWQVEDDLAVRRRQELYDRIRKSQAEIEEYCERDDEIAKLAIETRQEAIVELRNEIATIKTMRDLPKSSKFDERVKRMRNTIAWSKTAERVSGRAVSVAYFDDSRSILNYIP